jgi:hypothetical protein
VCYLRKTLEMNTQWEDESVRPSVHPSFVFHLRYYSTNFDEIWSWMSTIILYRGFNFVRDGPVHDVQLLHKCFISDFTII